MYCVKDCWTSGICFLVDDNTCLFQNEWLNVTDRSGWATWFQDLDQFHDLAIWSKCGCVVCSMPIFVEHPSSLCVHDGNWHPSIRWLTKYESLYLNIFEISKGLLFSHSSSAAIIRPASPFIRYIYTLSNLRPFFLAFFNMYLSFAFFRKKGTKDAKKVHKLNWMGIPCSQTIPRVDSAQLFPCQLVPVDDVQISADCALHCTIKLRINFGELSCLDVNYKSSDIYLWNPWSSLSSDILVIVYSGANMSQHLTGV